MSRKKLVVVTPRGDAVVRHIWPGVQNAVEAAFQGQPAIAGVTQAGVIRVLFAALGQAVEKELDNDE